MSRNVEIKARVADINAVRNIAATIATGPSPLIEQEDTFFSCPTGRLKVRRFSAQLGELIYYERPDTPDPAESRYIRAQTTDPGALIEALSCRTAIRGVIRKKRTLYLSGQTRIHIDEVDGLGHFVELEVVLDNEQTEAAGARIARELTQRLGIRPDQLVPEAYIDLLEQKERAGSPRTGM
jgi:predicted adenylyl cyclase CyaB